MQRFVPSALCLTLFTTGYIPNAVSAFPTYSPLLVALGKRTISADVAERGYTVHLSRGVGCVVNLSGVGEGISKIWLSDPSRLVFSQQGSVIYLKPIQELSFAGNYHAADGSSLMTVVTQSGKVYQFNLIITSDKPAYTALDITPQGFSPFPSRYPTTTAYRPRALPVPFPRRASQRSPIAHTSALPTNPKFSSAPVVSTAIERKDWKTVRPFVAPPAANIPQTQNFPIPAPIPVKRPESVTIQPSIKPILPAIESQSSVKIPDSVSKGSLQPQVSKSDPVRTEEFTPEVPPTAPEPLKLESATAKPFLKLAADPTTALANSIARGLPISIHNKVVRPYSGTYNKIQSVIGLLRTKKVKGIPDAAKRTGLTVALLNRIEAFGHPKVPSAVVPEAQTPSITPESTPNQGQSTLVSGRLQPNPKVRATMVTKNAPITTRKKLAQAKAPSSNTAPSPVPSPISSESIAAVATTPYSESLAAVAPVPVPSAKIAAATLPDQPFSTIAQTPPALLANAIARGLPVAIHNKRVRVHSNIYDSVQSAIGLLRRGQVKTLPAAAKRTGLRIALLDQLHAWGTQQ